MAEVRAVARIYLSLMTLESLRARHNFMDQKILDYALRGAILSSDLSVAASLVLEGADVNARDSTGRTSLHYAAGEDSSETIRWLLERGADVNACDGEGRSPLHCAVEQHSFRPFNPDILKLLCNSGVDIDARDRYGRTAKHLAEEMKLVGTSKFLKELRPVLIENCRDK